MAFRANPLSLSVPSAAFESWLRESGYLQVLDQRAPPSSPPSLTNGPVITLLSLLTVNPFSKLTSDDFSGPTPSWTSSFLGSIGSYSLPPSSAQARMRAHENVKRYARNYSSLFLLFFACSLYQMPFALVGLILSLALWDTFKFCGDRWGLDQYPVLRQILIRTAQCVTAVILIFSNVQMALFCTLGVSYAVMILHASFRNLAPSKQPNQIDGNRRR